MSMVCDVVSDQQKQEQIQIAHVVSSFVALTQTGGAPAMVQGGFAYFTDFNKSGIWRTKTSDSKSKPEQITAESTVLRYADFVVHPMDLDCLIAVREDHTIDEPAKVVNTLVCVDASSKKEWVIASGRDFYQSPRFNRDGSRICWTEVNSSNAFARLKWGQR